MKLSTSFQKILSHTFGEMEKLKQQMITKANFEVKK
jgi:hypothetical protein